MLLVGLILTIGITDGSEEVVLLVEHVVSDTGHVSELHVSVDVDLDDTEADGVEVLLLGRAGATVEDEEDGLVVVGADGLLDVGLVLAEKLRVELDVTGLVDTVNVAEAGGDGEVGGDGGEGVEDVEDVLGLGVEGVVVNILVVDTILLTTSDANLHLEPLLHGGSALEVLGGGLDVPLNGLLRKINHVRGEKRLAVGLKVSLISIEHAIEPGEELLGTVIGVKDDGDVVGRGDRADVVGGGNSAGNGGLLVTVAHTLWFMLVVWKNAHSGETNLASEVGSTALGELEDDGRLGVAGSLERSDDGGGGGDVLELALATILYTDVDRFRLKHTMAGIANCFSRAYSKRRRTSSPTMTPVFRLRTSWAPIVYVLWFVGKSNRSK